MIDLHLVLDEAHYRYLQQRARSRGTTVTNVVTDLIDAEIDWRQALADDAVAALFGEVSDTFDSNEIDIVLYSSAES